MLKRVLAIALALMMTASPLLDGFGVLVFGRAVAAADGVVATPSSLQAVPDAQEKTPPDKSDPAPLQEPDDQPEPEENTPFEEDELTSGDEETLSPEGTSDSQDDAPSAPAEPDDVSSSDDDPEPPSDHTPDAPAHLPEPDMPDAPETPDTPDSPDAPDAPIIPDAPMDSEVPTAPEMPDDPEDAIIPEMPLDPEVPDEPDEASFAPGYAHIKAAAKIYKTATSDQAIASLCEDGVVIADKQENERTHITLAYMNQNGAIQALNGWVGSNTLSMMSADWQPSYTTDVTVGTFRLHAVDILFAAAQPSVPAAPEEDITPEEPADAEEGIVPEDPAVSEDPATSDGSTDPEGAVVSGENPSSEDFTDPEETTTPGEVADPEAPDEPTRPEGPAIPEEGTAAEEDTASEDLPSPDGATASQDPADPEETTAPGEVTDPAVSDGPAEPDVSVDSEVLAPSDGSITPEEPILPALFAAFKAPDESEQSDPEPRPEPTITEMPKPLPAPVEELVYTVEWWDAHDEAARNVIPVTVSYLAPLAAEPGVEYEAPYVCEGGYVYRETATEDEEGNITLSYELVYEDAPRTVSRVIDTNDEYAHMDMFTYGLAFPDGAKEISVSFGAVDGYVSQEDDDAKTITYIKTKDVTFTKRWYDEDNAEGLRPDPETWLESCIGHTLYTSGHPFMDITMDQLSVDGSEWTVTVKDLPAFRSASDTIGYYLKENLPAAIVYPDEPAIGDMGYATWCDNPRLEQPTARLYSGGTSISIMRGLTQFTFNKVWLDELEPEQYDTGRPDVAFYLYRFVDTLDTSTLNDASPVRGMDRMTVTSDKSDKQYVYTVGGQSALDMFDENGNRYTYFVMERISGAGYQSEDKDGHAIRYLDNEGNAYTGKEHLFVSSGNDTIYNRRVGSVSPQVLKTWAATAVQGLHGRVLLGLQRRQASSDDPWEFARDDDGALIVKEQGGFKAEQMSLLVPFDTEIARFDEYGIEYEYRVVEIAAKVTDTDDAEPLACGEADPSFFREGDEFLSNGFRFQVHYSDDGTTVINQLVGETDIIIDKTFRPGIPEAKTASVWLQVQRDQPFTDEELAKWEEHEHLHVERGSDDATFFTLVSARSEYDATSNCSRLYVELEGLSRYDADGREYAYTVTELDDPLHRSKLGDTEYYFGSMQCVTTDELDENGEHRKVLRDKLTNIGSGSGFGLTFRVRKQWLDDNDLLDREPVQIGLYYRGADGSEEKVYPGDESWVELSKDNEWYYEFRYIIPAAGLTEEELARRSSFGNYFTREISVGGHPVQDGSDGAGLDALYVEGKPDQRYVCATQHIYIVEDEKAPEEIKVSGETYGDCVITNIRVGDLKVKITKEWNLGDLRGSDLNEGSGEGLTATFHIMREGFDSPVGTITLSNKDAEDFAVSDPLPKYDETGRVITYWVEEAFLNDTAFVDNAIECLDYSIISAINAEDYKLGAYNQDAFGGNYLHTYDYLERTFTNQRRRTASVVVNKVWHDVGSDIMNRPDIVLHLYRHSTNPSAAGKEDIEVLNDSLWDTKINDYYWQCNFGPMDRYDSEGYEYLYYVTEVIPQESEYTDNISYYNGTEQPNEMTDPACARDVFLPLGGTDTFAWASMRYTDGDQAVYLGRLPGTIINTPARTAFFHAYKKWESLPNWVLRDELPSVEVKLMRTYTEKGVQHEEECPLRDPQRTLSNQDNYLFTAFIPYYNEYGTPYDDYYLRERDENANAAYVATYSESAKDIVNVYTGYPKIHIGVTKTWDWSAIRQQAIGQETYPALDFELWQSLSADGVASVKEPTLVGTAHLDSGDVVAQGALTIPTLYFTNVEDAAANDEEGGLFETVLWLSASGDGETRENRQCYYSYWIVEKWDGEAHAAYEVVFEQDSGEDCVSAVHLMTKEDVENGFYAFPVTNRYQTSTTVEATKVWKDKNDLLGLRPSVEDGVLVYHLWREVPSTGDTEEVTSVEATWTDNGKNTWTCVFTPIGDETLPVYGTENEAYVYYVTEELLDPYTGVYYIEDPPTKPGLSFTNDLNTVALYARKVWQFQNGEKALSWSDLSSEQRKDVVYFTGIASKIDGSDAKITYRVTAADENGEPIGLFEKDGQKTATIDCDILFADWLTLTGKTGCRLLGSMTLPRYVINTDPEGNKRRVEVVYTVEEYAVGGVPVVYADAEEDDATVKNGAAGCVTVQTAKTAMNDSGAVCTFTGLSTNTMVVSRLVVDKVWNDEGNREGKRPTSVSYELESHLDGAAEVARQRTRPLSMTTDAKVSASNGNGTTGNYAYYLPMETMDGKALTFTVHENVPTGYTPEIKTIHTAYSAALRPEKNDYVYDPGSLSEPLAEDSYVIMRNTYVPHKLSVSVSKAWDLNGCEYLDIAMPDEITVRLQRKADDETDWADVDGCTAVLRAGSWTFPGEPWDVDCYRAKANAELVYSSHVYTYRVVEVIGGAQHETGEEAHHGFSLTVSAEAANGTVTGALGGNTWTTDRRRDVSFAMTNSLTTTGITVSKAWAKDAKALTDRPATVRFQVFCQPEGADAYALCRDDQSEVILALSEDNEWRDTVSGLPTHDGQGRTLTYFARELDPSPLYVSTSKRDLGLAFTNTLKTVSLLVKKVWEDSDDHYQTRQDLTIDLYQSRDQVTWTLFASKKLPVGTTQVKFTDLPALYADETAGARPYFYKAVEVPAGDMKDYGTTVSVAATAQAGTAYADNEAAQPFAILSARADQTAQNVSLGTVTFCNTLDGFELEVTKNWDDAAYAALGTRPDQVNIVLQRKAGGDWEDAPYQEHTAIASGKAWTVVFHQLPKSDANGAAYQYRIVEQDLLGYALRSPAEDNACASASVTAGTRAKETLRLVNSQKLTSVEVRKSWEDDPFGVRPAAVRVQLQWSTDQKNWTPVQAGSYEDTMNAGNDWTCTFAALPLADKADRQLYYRAVEMGSVVNGEVEPLNGYTAVPGAAVRAAQTDDGAQAYTLANRLDPFSFTVVKRWMDENDRFGMRPASLTIHLLWRTEDTDWTPVPYAPYATCTLTPGAEGNEWTYTFLRLPRYNAEGEKLLYCVQEDVPAGYRWTDQIDGHANTIADATSTAAVQLPLTNEQQQTSVLVTKTWDDEDTQNGVRPSAIAVKLQCSTDGDIWADVRHDPVHVLTAETWTTVFGALPIADGSGTRLRYRVVELGVPGENAYTELKDYTIAYAPLSAQATAGAQLSLGITNTLRRCDLTVTKTWNDQNNAYRLRPTAVVFALERRLEGEDAWTPVLLPDGVTPLTATATAPDWQAAFNDLPRTDRAGTAYQYRAVETVPPAYSAQAGQVAFAEGKAAFVNDLRTMDLTIQKHWDDESDRYDLRPAKVEFALFATVTPEDEASWTAVTRGEGENAAPVVIEMSAQAGDDWTCVFAGLPAEDAQGRAYTYRAVETVPTGYLNAAPVCVAVSGNVSFTNKLETVQLSVEKTWDDQQNKYATRPAAIQLALWRQADAAWEKVTAYGDQGVITVAPDDNGQWRHAFTALPKRDAAGVLYTYKVIERRVNGYRASDVVLTDGQTAVLENHLNVISLTARKRWDDQDDFYGLRPDGVQFTLYASADSGVTWAEVPYDAAGFVTLNAAGEWAVRFESVPETDPVTGNTYLYRVDEAHVNGYVGNAPVVFEGGEATVTNTLRTESDLVVRKYWADFNDRYALRPESILLTLQHRTPASDWSPVRDAKGAVITQTLTSDTWMAKFTGLPAVEPETEAAYEYRVVETVPGGYKAIDPVAFTGGVADVRNTLDTTSITISKTWDDAQNLYGTRPETLRFALEYRANGQEWAALRSGGEPVVVEMTGDATADLWRLTVEDLPAADDKGRSLTYRVVEAVPNGYREVVDSYLRRTNRLVTVSLDLSKAWEDQRDLYATRPQTISVTLQRRVGEGAWEDVLCGGEPLTAVLTEGRSWTCAFNGLPKYDLATGNVVSYRAVEETPYGYTALPAEFTAPSGETARGSARLTNTLQETSLTLSKTWADQDDRFSMRPTSIQVTLERSLDGTAWTPVENARGAVTATLSAAKGWTATFDKLPKYDPATGAEVLYRAVEAVPNGYRSAPVVFADQTAALTNTLIETELTLSKVWQDQDDFYHTRPDAIRVALERSLNGTNWTNVRDVNGPIEATLTAANGWTAVFAGLPVYDAQTGAEVRYRAVETVPNGYTSAPAVFANQQATLTNTLIETELALSKTWVDQDDRFMTRPADIRVTLERSLNGADWTSVQTTSGPVRAVLTAAGQWTAVFAKLPKYDLATGTAWLYRVVEDVPNGYTSAPAVSADQKAVLTNTLEAVGLTVSKTWLDQDDRFGTRPASIRVTLERSLDGVEWTPVRDVRGLVQATLTAENGWTATFGDLPRLDTATGAAYLYRAAEDVPNGYTSAPAIFARGQATLVNTLEEVDLTLTKVWIDQNDRFDTRPASVTVALERSVNGTDWAPVMAADGTAIDGRLSAANRWTLRFERLPRYDAQTGAALRYRAVETVPAHYESAPAVFTDGAATLINRSTDRMDAVTLTVRKRWEDQDNAFGTRPDAITVRLQQYVGQRWVDTGLSATLTPADGWQASFADLPRLDDDELTIRYRAVETVPGGYTTAPAEFDDTDAILTNRLSTVSLTLRKNWLDDNDRSGLRPDSIEATVQRKVGAEWRDVLVGGAPLNVTLSRDNNWIATLPELPKLDPATGKAWQYRAVENVPEGYLSEGPAVFTGAVAVLTNTLAEPPVPRTDVAYTLLIDYIYIDGTTAAESHFSRHREGDVYSVVSPVIPGYTCSQLLVEGVMPARNLHFIVIYIPGEQDDGSGGRIRHGDDYTVIEDAPVPLGFGNVPLNVGDCFE